MRALNSKEYFFFKLGYLYFPKKFPPLKLPVTDSKIFSKLWNKFLVNFREIIWKLSVIYHEREINVPSVTPHSFVCSTSSFLRFMFVFQIFTEVWGMRLSVIDVLLYPEPFSLWRMIVKIEKPSETMKDFISSRRELRNLKNHSLFLVLWLWYSFLNRTRTVILFPSYTKIDKFRLRGRSTKKVYYPPFALSIFHAASNRVAFMCTIF